MIPSSTTLLLTTLIIFAGFGSAQLQALVPSKESVVKAINPHCPADYRAVDTTLPGCPCQPDESPQRGACPPGYQCASPWSVIPGGHFFEGKAICVPCVYGQYCPRGSFLPPPSDLEHKKESYVEKYLCKPGFFCPVPDRSLPCPPGRFCPKASVGPTTCDLKELLDKQPQTVIPPEPRSVASQVFVEGTPIGGNFCPPTSTTPGNACAAGYYCPNASSIIPCPQGSFCKWYSTLPKKCPWLAACPPGSRSADLSLGGFLGLMLILLVLWLAYVALSAYIRLQQDRLVMRQAAKDKLQQLVAPLLCVHDPQALALKAFGSIRPRISLRFEECGLLLRDGRQVLSGVTGYFGHSKVSAVMGPSGSGKSTLLAVLMGTATYGTFTGQVWINGRLMRVSRLRRIMGYVPQDDILHEDLTVRENLAYSAWLRSTIHMVSEAKGEVVDDVIDLLRLRHVQHSLVGSVEKRGISGGQRKRVNIGLELVAKPSLLFMDEPTSGLDATAATDILSALRKMTGLGMNIVVVLHQPRFSVFSLFHEVLFLGKQGRTVFLGPANAAVPYFASLGFEFPPNENPADICLDIISGAVPCRGKPDFQAADLDAIWEIEAVNWAGAGDAQPEQDAVAKQPSALSPEQLSLVHSLFNKVDQEHTGKLAPEAITLFLTDLGLEPTSVDVELIMGELDASGAGAVTREDLLQFIRNGGRRQPPIPEHTLDRRLSIELDADKVEASERVGSVRPEDASQLEPSAFASPPPATIMARHDVAGQLENDKDEASRNARSAPGGSSPKRSWNHALRPSLGNGHSGDEERGMSPSTSQQWDFETLSALSQPATIEEIVEEPEKPGCWQSFKTYVTCTGKRCWKWLRKLRMRKRSRYRRIPGNWAQFKLLFRRAGVKWVRGWGYKFIDLLLFVTAAIVIGAVQGTAWEIDRIRGNVTLSMLTLAIISVIASLGVFTKDRLVFWRESASGLRTSAYFLGHAGLNLIDITVQPAIFMSLYYTLTLPEIDFVNYYIVAWLVAWYASGIGYWASVALAPQNSMVAAATCIMILGGFLNGVDPRFRNLSPFMKHVIGLSYGRWAVEAVTIQEFKQYAHYLQPRVKFIMMEVGYCGLDHEPFGTQTELDVMSYCKGYVAWDIMSLFVQGTVLRLLTYIWLRFYNSDSRGNPIYRMFTAMWARCLRQGRRRWVTVLNGGVVLPATIIAGAASENATAGNIAEPLLQAQRESSSAHDCTVESS